MACLVHQIDTVHLFTKYEFYNDIIECHIYDAALSIDDVIVMHLMVPLLLITNLLLLDCDSDIS